MSREVVLNDQIVSDMKRVLGEEISPSDFAVFEVRAFSTEPIQQPDSFYDGAVTDYQFINQAAEWVKNPSNNVGVLIQHDFSELNIGRVFDAWVKSEEGSVTALHARMAVLRRGNEELIDKLNNGVVDEVSCTFSFEHAKCSVCGYDYFDPSVDEDEFFDCFINRTCPNGHTLGVDGCHLVLSGLEFFNEISFVNNGAAHRAKVKKRQEQGKFSQTLVEKGKMCDKLSRMKTLSLNSKVKDMDEIERLKLELSEAQSKIAELESKESENKLSEPEKPEEPSEIEANLDECMVEIAHETDSAVTEPVSSEVEIEAKFSALADSLNSKVAEFTSVLKTKDSEIEALRKEYAELKASFVKEVNKSLTAAGKAQLKDDSSIETILTSLEQSRVTLAASIPIGGRSKGASSSFTEKVFYGKTEAQLGAFKTNRSI